MPSYLYFHSALVMDKHGESQKVVVIMAAINMIYAINTIK